MGRLSDNMGRLRDEITASRSARLAFTFDLKRDVAQMQADFRDARIAASKSAKAERMQFIGDLAAFVADMRISVLGMRQKYAEDLAGARHAWQSRSTSPERARKRETPVQHPVRANAEVRVMEIAEAISDDLTAIPGIGPGRMTRLNEAGIHSFKDLARCTPEKLMQIMGKPLKMTDVERWVVEAGKLVGHY
jgi:predicted flap endonuclease-1-like 5' DNA nuclease